MTSTTYQVGDPDPTPYLKRGFCGDDQVSDFESRFCCTWPEGHDGPHVAGNGETIVAVWE